MLIVNHVSEHFVRRHVYWDRYLVVL